MGFRRRRVVLPIPRYTRDNVLLVRDLLATGRYRAVIDRRSPVAEVVAANRYVETGRKTGNVVLTVGEGGAGHATGAGRPAR